MKLSVVIPVYNERETLEEVVRAVKSVDLPRVEREIVIVDDGSTDGTRDIITNMEGVQYIFHDENLGKGSALTSGLQKVTGDIVLIQDADLEYDPSEYSKLIGPILKGKADVVYGSRFMGGGPHRVLYFFHSFGNKFLTLISNIFTGLNLSDMETCYKVFRKEVVDSFKDKLVSKRFGIEPEITAYIARGSWRVYEVGISYYGRTYAEGKKINWKDGFAALWHIIRFTIFRR